MKQVLIAALKQIVTSKIPDWKQLVVDSFIEFLKKKYTLPVKIDIKIGKESSKKKFGGADFGAFQKGKYKIKVNDAMLPVLLSRIGHEFLHLVQFRDKQLELDVQNKMLLWEGKPYMTIMEYNKTTNYDKYKKIPWEKAAIEGGPQLVDEYKNSKYLKKVKETDHPTLRYIIDNDLLLL